jgi:microcystin-dependent protein
MPTTPYLGQIMMVSFNFAPKGWAQCNGQLMAISQNQALFSILGTTYGGNGVTTFALPNLQGRTPLHMGGNFTLGQQGGEVAHTLNISETPTHQHPVIGSSLAATASDPAGAYLATAGVTSFGPSGAVNTAMAPATVTAAGGSQPHENQSPFQVLVFVIALQGIFPSRS